MRALLLVLAIAACGGGRDAAPARGIRLLHTFGARESELLGAALAGWPVPVSTSLVPFARGQTVIGALLRAGTDCPDLIRVDATWLPALVRAHLVLPAPPEAARRDWLPEARALAQAGGPGDDAMYGVPQTVDGLVVVLGPAAADLRGPPPTTIDGLVRDAQGAQTAGWAKWGLGLRVDGYWVVPFLRAAGADVADGSTGALGVDNENASAAVARFASLFGTVAAPAPAPGQEAADEARRFQAGEIALLVTGPWAIADLGALDALRVWPLPDAPRGGQLFVVPRCAADAARAWQLALHLTEPDVQLAWARALGTVPTTQAAIAGAPRVVREVYAALREARPLPRDPATALLFDDLSPAVAAVVAGDATADEAMAGVARAWKRLLGAPR